MVILPYPALLDLLLTHFAPQISSPCKGGEVGMGQNFSSAPQDEVRIGLDFLDPSLPCPASPRIDNG